MGLLLPLRCVLLLSAALLAAGSDFLPGSETSFARRPLAEEGAVRVAKRSLPAWLAAAPLHKIRRRSTEQGDSCKALQGYEAKLADNTHRVSLPAGPVTLRTSDNLMRREETTRRCRTR